MIRINFKTQFFIVIVFILLSSMQIIAQDENKTTTNVLFIGNSFTLNNNMPSTFEKIAKSNHQSVKVLMSAKGGHSFQMHADRKELFEDINKETWDYVVLQGFSRELMFGKKYTDSVVIPPLNKIIDSIKYNNPCVNILFYMTWGYENGYNNKDTTFSYDQMTDSIENGYLYLSELYNVPVVPIGMIWKEIRKRYPDYNLYHPDGSHPSKLASFIIANAFLYSIYREIPNTDAFLNVFEHIQIDNIKYLIYNYIDENKEKYKQNVNFIETKLLTEQNIPELQLHIDFPEARFFEINFGDKTIIRDIMFLDLNHKYSKNGIYTLKISIRDVCGERKIVRNIYFIETVFTTKKTKKKRIKRKN